MNMTLKLKHIYDSSNDKDLEMVKNLRRQVMAPVPVEIGINTTIQNADFDSAKVALRNIFVVVDDHIAGLYLFIA